METIPQDTKKVFWKMGTCSRTFFFLLDRAFGQPMEAAERAADTLAGGIMQKGHQCGMLWGSALALGAESFRRNHNRDQAIGLAISATRYLLESFTKRTNTVDCREITGTDFSNKWQMLRYILFRARSCFNLAEDWAPEAIEAALEGLAADQRELPDQPMSCASEVVRRMGAGDEEMVMVAGFAGGMGLSGHGCGALGAAIWMKSLHWVREHPGKSAYSIPEAKSVLNAFEEATGGELRCHKICGRHFETIEEHTAFVKNGGCSDLIALLAQT